MLFKGFLSQLKHDLVNPSKPYPIDDRDLPFSFSSLSFVIAHLTIFDLAITYRSALYSHNNTLYHLTSRLEYLLLYLEIKHVNM